MMSYQETNLVKYIRIAGIACIFLGAVDPLEASVVILIGSYLYTLSMYLKHHEKRFFFLICSLMMTAGIFFMFFFSWLGGIGGKSEYSLWWGILILPYPVAWLITVFSILRSGFEKKGTVG